MSSQTPGAAFRAALALEQPLQVPGAINAYHALLAQKSGFRAIYLSGGGVAAGSLGLARSRHQQRWTTCSPTCGASPTSAPLPLLVDVDTGFGASAFNIARTVRSLIKAGAAAMHIEDQVGAKRCGHRPGKELVSQDEMVGPHQGRRRCARPIRRSSSWRVPTRWRSKGSMPPSTRAVACVEAGADMIFPEAITELDDVPPLRRCGEGPGPRQHHRIRQDAAVHARRTARARAWRSRCIRCRPSAR